MDRDPETVPAREVLADLESLAAVSRLAPVGIFRTDAHGGCTFVNDRWCELAGMEPEEALGDGWHRAVHEDDRARVLAEWNVVVRMGRAFASEYRFRAPDGRVTWLSSRAVGLKGDDGSGAGYLGTVTDIGEQRGVQEALRRNEERLRGLIQNIPGMVYRCAVNEDWTFEFVSPAVEWLSGHPTHEFLAGERTWASVIAEEDRDLVWLAVLGGLERREPFELEYRIVRADGAVRWVYERGQGVFDGAGEVVWVDGTIFDVTRQREAEAELSRAAALVMTLIESLRSGVLVEDASRQIAFVNQVVCDDFSLGSEREALIGAEARLAFELLASLAAEPETVAKRIRDIGEAFEPVRAEELLLSDGRTLELDHAPIVVDHDRGGHLWHYRDITARKRVEEELARQNEELRALDKLKDDFVALVTHELRTPVTSIMGYSDLLLDDADSLTDWQAQCLAVVQRNAKRLLRLVGDLLFTAQLEAGTGTTLERGPVALSDVIAESVEGQRPRAERQRVGLVVDAARAPIVEGDAERLGQLLDNLVSNAVKYSPDGGVVRVRAFVEGAVAVLEVSDEGIGIPEADQARLFERFFRASTATSRAIKGTGLGLTVCRTIADAHGGRISFVSHEGRGTTFRVELPAAAEAKAA
jgi:PAS domain S-box-containing protein